MPKIIIIGTLHAGLTPNAELIAEIEKHRPDQVLVEIAAADIEKNDLGKYPPEMVAAYEWAKTHGVEVHGFDSGENTLREGVGEAENNALIEKQDARMKGLTWKDLNKRENDTLLDVAELAEVVDHEKEMAREQAMLANINRLLREEGATVVITGTGHLPYLEANINNASFPLR